MKNKGEGEKVARLIREYEKVFKIKVNFKFYSKIFYQNLF
jgi:hypothetical protein